MGCRLLKGDGCLSNQVSHRLTMFTDKDVDSLSGAEHDMVLDRQVNQVRMVAQLVHRVGSEPLILWGHTLRMCRDLCRVYCVHLVLLHHRQRWLKSRTTKRLLLALTL